MTVSINPIQRPESGLSKLASLVSIAKNVYGIKTDIDQRELEQQRFDADQRRQQQFKDNIGNLNVTSPEEAQGIASAGFVPAPSDFGGNTRKGMLFGQEQPFALAQDVKAQQIEKAANRKAAEIAQADRKNNFKKQTDIRKEYDKASNDTFEAIRGFKKVENAANSKNPTGAEDVALVFGFMKTIDPESVVREGEFATAENTSGVPDRVRVAYNKLLNGDRLSPEQRSNFVSAARNQLRGQLELQKLTDDRYADIAQSGGLDVERIINPIFGQEYERVMGGGGELLSEDNRPDGGTEALGSEDQPAELPSYEEALRELNKRKGGGFALPTPALGGR